MGGTVKAVVNSFGINRDVTFRIEARVDLFQILDRISRYGNHISHRIVWDAPRRAK